MIERLRRFAPWIAAAMIAAHAWFLLGAAAPSTRVLSPLATQVKGPTFDEYFYISAGVSYWKSGDFSENREHPPLAKLMAGLPVALQGDIDFPPHWRDWLHFPVQFFYEHNAATQARNLYLSRLPGVFLALALDLVLYLTAAGMAGAFAGLTALSLAAFDPSCIASAATANLDFPAAAFDFLALVAARRLLIKKTWGSATLAALALGAALLAKWTSLLLAPALVAMVIAQILTEKSIRPAVRFALVCVAAFSVFSLGYGFETRSLDSVRSHPKFTAKSKRPDGTQNILERPFIRAPVETVFGEHRGVPLLTSIKGLDHTLSETGQIGHAGYLLGETTGTTMKKDPATGREFPAFIGWKTYYLAVIPQKLPLTTLILLLGGLCMIFVPGRSWLDRAFLFVFPATVLLQFSLSNAQLGIKYVLPALFPLFTASGLLAARPLAGIAIALIAFLGAAQATVRSHPDEAMFSSVLAGGVEQGARVACVGDDWGQDAPALALFARELQQLGKARAKASTPAESAAALESFRRAVDAFTTFPESGEEPSAAIVAAADDLLKTGLAYRYYGEGDPSYYGYEFDVLGLGERRGVVAVHATTLYRENEQFSWLERFDPAAADGEPMPGIYRYFVHGAWIVKRRPFAKIGHAIYVYLVS